MTEHDSETYRDLLVRNLEMKKVRPYGPEHESIWYRLTQFESRMTVEEIIANTEIAFIKI